LQRTLLKLSSRSTFVVLRKLRLPVVRFLRAGKCLHCLTQELFLQPKSRNAVATVARHATQPNPPVPYRPNIILNINTKWHLSSHLPSFHLLTAVLSQTVLKIFPPRPPNPLASQHLHPSTAAHPTAISHNSLMHLRPQWTLLQETIAIVQATKRSWRAQ
jgi:hypothetical protein